MNKLMAAFAALAMVAAPLAASAQPTGHGQGGGAWSGGDHRDGRGFERDRGGGGAVVAAGLFGLILGSAIANADNHPYAYASDYGPRCGWRTEAYRTVYGNIAYQQVQVCR